LRRVGIENTSALQLWQPSLQLGHPDVFLGYPVIATEKLSALGLKGDIVLADLGKYWIGDRGGLKVDSSIHDRFRQDETVIRLVKRVDGQPAIARALVVLGR